MRRAFLFVLLLCSTVMAWAQNPPPKNPKDPEEYLIPEPKQDTLHLTSETLIADDDFTQPHFPGGLKKFYIYLSKNIHYPPGAVKNHIEGKVYLVFAIEKDGSIGDIKITKGVSKEIDAEAVRVLKNSPKWIPGTHHRKPNVVYESIPMNFQLPKTKISIK